MDYILMTPPFIIGEFRKLSRIEAKQHFDWYVKQIPSRLSLLQDYYTESCSIGNHLDFSEQSLVNIWNWFIENVEIIEKLNSEIEEEKAIIPNWMHETITQTKIATKWKSIAHDIGLYFATSLIKGSNSLKWDIIYTPKNFISVNKPIVSGFNSKLILDPAIIISNLSNECIDNSAVKEDLLNTYKYWQKNSITL